MSGLWSFGIRLDLTFRLYSLHAIEMMAILFIFVPLGIYIARYGTRVDLWLPWHKWLMVRTCQFCFDPDVPLFPYSMVTLQSLALGEFAFTLRTIFTQMTTFGVR